MRTVSKLSAAFLIGLIFLFMLPRFATAQSLKTLSATAKGRGTLTVGRDEFKINSIVVQLKESGEAEITLVTDIPVFVKGEWSGGDNVNDGINLKITGGTVSSRVKGKGHLLMRPDAKSIASLSLSGRATGDIKFEAQFIAN
jgi:hypothetical protein